MVGPQGATLHQIFIFLQRSMGRNAHATNSYVYERLSSYNLFADFYFIKYLFLFDRNLVQIILILQI